MPELQKTEKINGNFEKKDILSLDQFDLQSLELLFSTANDLQNLAIEARPSDLITGNIVTLLFFEPSSRTFGSFATAVKQIGGQTLEIQNPQTVSSVAKGETLADTIRTFQSYTHAIVLRHPEIGAVQKAADVADIPVINAGDGAGEHPTQALLDMYTIHEKHGRLNSLTGVMAGDMLNGRTVHSLLKGLSLFDNNTMYLLSPKSLQLTRSDFTDFSQRGITLIEIEDEKDIPKNADFWYWTRVQKERFSDLSEYEQVKTRFTVTKQLMADFAAEHMILMHPLPRVGEILEEVDADPRSVYLTKEMRNGKYIRMALMALVMGKV